MGRRKKQHDRLAFGATPWWLYELLEAGYLNMTEFVVWSIIRGYVKDEIPGVFSPSPIDLSNREIARGTTLTTDRVRVVLKDLEDRGYLQRITGEDLRELGLGGNRWLLLLAPQGIPQRVPLEDFPLEIAGGNLAGGKIAGGLNNNTSSSSSEARKTSRDSASEVDVVVESRAGEGGTGEGANNPLEIAGGYLAGGKIAGGNSAGGSDKGENRRKDVAELLKELHVFPRANFHIADKMLADAQFSPLQGAALLSEVRATFFRVFNQERTHAKSDAEAMRFTVNRLKAGDWGAGFATVLAEADRRKRDRDVELYASRAPLPEKPRQPWEDSPYPQAARVQPLWQDTLGEAKLQLTRATFDLWLRDSVALGINSDGQTLVVRVKNYQAVEWLTGKLYDVIHRSLVTNLTDGEGDAYGLEVSPATLGVRFVTGEMLENEGENEGVDAA